MTLYHLCLLAVGAVLLLPEPQHRRLGGVALTAMGLALAAFGARLDEAPTWHLAEQIAVNGAPLGFLRINAGLALAAGGLALLTALAAGRRPARPVQTVIALAIITAGISALLWSLAPVIRYVGWRPVVLAALGITLIVGGLGWAAAALHPGAVLQRLDQLVLARRDWDVLPRLSSTADVVWTGVFAVGCLPVLVGEPLWLFLLGAVVAAIAAHVIMRRQGGGWALPVLPLLMIALVPVYRYTAAIGAGAPLDLGTLSQAPWSEAAQNLLLPWLALAAWGLSGLWPLHGVTPGGVASFLGGVLLLRFGAGILPDGVEHWAPLIALIATLGLWHAALTLAPENRRRRITAGLVALAAIGIMGSGGAGTLGAFWLLATAGLYPALSGVADYLPELPFGAARLLWLPAAWGALHAVQAGLAGETVYTTVAAVGVGVAMKQLPNAE